MREQIICSTCGTYYPLADAPEICTICLDERQYVPVTGQSWIKQEDLHRKHSVKISKL